MVEDSKQVSAQSDICPRISQTVCCIHFTDKVYQLIALGVFCFSLPKPWQTKAFVLVCHSIFQSLYK